MQGADARDTSTDIQCIYFLGLLSVRKVTGDLIRLLNVVGVLSYRYDGLK